MQLESPTPDIAAGELLFYTSKDGKVKMEIRVEEETIWMSQQMMAELFQTTKQNIAKHLKRIFEQEELQEEAVVNYWLTTAADGKKYTVTYYNISQQYLWTHFTEKSSAHTCGGIWHSWPGCWCSGFLSISCSTAGFRR